MKRDWILLRGLARESGHWGKFLDDFVSRFSDDRVLTIDLPGAGKHFAERCPTSVEAMMEQVRAEYRGERDGGREIVLFGHSLGAMVALAWAKKYPGEISRVVLVNPSVGGLSPLSRRLGREGMTVARKLMRARTSVDKERAVLDWIVNDESARAAHAEAWAKIRDARPVSTGNLVRQLIAGARFRLDDDKFGIPILILCGGRDRLAHPSCSRAIQQHLGCDLETHPTAGHDLSLDQPEWVLSTIGRWLSVHRDDAVL